MSVYGGAIRLYQEGRMFSESRIMVSRRSLMIFGVVLLLASAAVMLQRLRSGPESTSITVGDGVVLTMTKCKPGQNMDG
ncbi:MAG: hypothetical protein ACK51K_01395, partial [Gammaproteobacteria bacterium]